MGASVLILLFFFGLINGYILAKELFVPAISIVTFFTVAIKFFSLGKPSSCKLIEKDIFFLSDWGIQASETPEGVSLRISMSAYWSCWILDCFSRLQADRSMKGIEFSSVKMEDSWRIWLRSVTSFFTRRVRKWRIIPLFMAFWTKSCSFPREHQLRIGHPQYFTVVFKEWKGTVLGTAVSASRNGPNILFGISFSFLLLLLFLILFLFIIQF